MPARPLTPRARQPGKTLLTGWLLLLLCEGEQHGWALRTQLAERGIVVDASVYRHLRELESEGALASRWVAPVGGPRRRRYGLADGGPARLDELAATISSTWRLHADFVEAQQRADLPQAPAARQQTAPAATVGREILSAWLLLLLDDRASYGYDLRHALQSHHVESDPGALYRVLRQLDDEGLLRSRWVDSTAGPRRREYRVTAKGRRTLGELTGLITAIRDRHRAFLQEYERVRGNRADVAER